MLPGTDRLATACCCPAPPADQPRAPVRGAPAAPPTTFSVSPDRLPLGPREAATVTITGSASAQGSALEVLTCTASFGTPAGKGAAKVFEVQAQADLAAPLLDFSARSLAFEYMYTPGRCATLLQQPLVIR
jgi:hydrocephalus-inducing protein